MRPRALLVAILAVMLCRVHVATAAAGMCRMSPRAACCCTPAVQHNPQCQPSCRESQSSDDSAPVIASPEQHPISRESVLMTWASPVALPHRGMAEHAEPAHRAEATSAPPQSCSLRHRILRL